MDSSAVYLNAVVVHQHQFPPKNNVSLAFTTQFHFRLKQNGTKRTHKIKKTNKQTQRWMSNEITFNHPHTTIPKSILWLLFAPRAHLIPLLKDPLKLLRCIWFPFRMCESWLRRRWWKIEWWGLFAHRRWGLWMGWCGSTWTTDNWPISTAKSI